MTTPALNQHEPPTRVDPTRGAPDEHRPSALHPDTPPSRLRRLLDALAAEQEAWEALERARDAVRRAVEEV